MIGTFLMKNLNLEPYFLKTNKKIENTQAYLGPSKISMMELFSDMVEVFSR